VSAFEGTLLRLKKIPRRVHNPRTMRVLIADRNARLLEAISRTFAQQFAIQTAASCERCNELLAQGDFDLVLISEKLADGLGLQLLGQIARSSPDTLRVFAARRSRLQLLKGKLGPFGLFRTLSYPINPHELLSTLTLAQTGLAIGASVSASDEAADVQPQGEGPTPSSMPAEVHPVVERISLTSADATFAVNVPKAILSQRKARRSLAHRPTSAAREAPAPATPVRNAAPEAPSVTRQVQKAPPELPGAARQAQRGTPQLTPAAPQSQGGAPQQPRSSVAQQAPAAPQSGRAQQHPPPHPARSQAAVAHPAASVRSPSPSGASQHAARRHEAPNGPVVGTHFPVRSKIVLAATSVVVFLVTTLTLNLNDASVHVTRASTPRPRIELPPAPEPPAALAPAFRPERTVARHVEPKPAAVDPAGEQVTASNAPVADPATFSHEAYEVVYAN